MKYLLLLLMVGNTYAVDWEEHPYDKLSHVAIGGVISCAVTAGTDNKLYGFLAALGVGAIKEATDQKFDTGDFASWGVGGAVGTLCIRF